MRLLTPLHTIFLLTTVLIAAYHKTLAEEMLSITVTRAQRCLTYQLRADDDISAKFFPGEEDFKVIVRANRKMLYTATIAPTDQVNVLPSLVDKGAAPGPLDFCFTAGSTTKKTQVGATPTTARFTIKDTIVDPLDKTTVTSLSELLSRAQSLGKSIVKEFDYMRTREIRMHKTSESTSTRIRLLSYVSFAAMIAVAVVQGIYFRGYFRRKKLL